MAYMEWQNSFSVNVKEIDDQHRALIEMINHLHDAMVASKGREIHHETIVSMVNYAHVHFDTEERYMQRSMFPGIVAHRAEHEQFKLKAHDLRERAANDSFILTIEILSFLRDWLQNHILGTDAQYASHFRTHGLHGSGI